LGDSDVLPLKRNPQRDLQRDLSGAGGVTFDYARSGGWNGADSPIRADGSVDYANPAVRDGGASWHCASSPRRNR